MDVLKYIDILIGLAIVMVLLSPLVTAITQLILYIGDSRARFLGAGLRNLLQQLDYDAARSLKITDADGNAAPDVSVKLPGSEDLLTTGADGRVQLPDPFPAGSLRGRTLILSTAPLYSIEIGHLREGKRVCKTVREKADATGKISLRLPALPEDEVWGDATKALTRYLQVTDSAGRKAPKAEIKVQGIEKPLVTDENGRLEASPARLAAIFSLPAASTLTLNTLKVELRVTSHGKPANDPPDAYTIAQPPLSPGADGKLSLPLPSLMTREAAKAIARAVQIHPMIAKVEVVGWLSWMFKTSRRNGEVIEREELIRVLLELAANEGSGATNLADSFRTILKNVLTLNSVPSPGQALAKIRDEAQALEKDQPNLAAHVRQTTAIITAAPSDFVGKINNWFDQTMDRVTERYALTARAWTVLGALIVAFIVQIDSLDLLRRLSVDDKFRQTLVSEAEAQQKRIDSAATTPAAPPGQLETAQAKRDEIEQSLAQLRTPDLAILPDHFIWEPTPSAVLRRNPIWGDTPFPATFELVVGSASWTISPRWQRDPLTDLKVAIESSAAPVKVAWQSGDGELVLNSSDANGVELTEPGKTLNLLTPIRTFAQARLDENPAWQDSFTFTGANALQLTVGSHRAIPIELTAAKTEVIQRLRNSLEGNKDAHELVFTAIAKNGKELIIAAKSDKDRDITLRWSSVNPFTNVLNTTQTAVRTGTIRLKDVKSPSVKVVDGDATMDLTPGDVTAAVTAVNTKALPVSARQFVSDELLLTSRRIGALELRYKPRDAGTNILNAPEDTPVFSAIYDTLHEKSTLGVLVSWILLSLGAPFWYDALKDLLKLRPAIAGKEEAQRNDRRTETKPEPPPAPKPPTK